MNALRIFIPFALGYFLSYLLRVVNAVIAPDLTADLGLNATDLGLLTSVSFLSFAGFQVPLGMLLDRYGPRLTESVLLLFAAVGAVVFALGDSLPGLIVGRALIGLGTSACLMAAFKAYTSWFHQDRIPMINGFQMMAGGMGALAGTVPVEMALETTDWGGVYMGFAIMAVVVAVLLMTVVPKHPVAKTRHMHFRAQLSGVGHVFSSPYFWRVTPVTLASQSSFLAIQSLWSGPWLMDVAGFSRASVAETLFLVAASMVAGFLTLGVVSERLGRFGISPMVVGLSGMGVFIATQILIILTGTAAPVALWMVFGFFGTSGILPYAALTRGFPLELSGRVVTGINLLVFGGAFLAQWGMGWVINFWPDSNGSGYQEPGYQTAFAVMIGFQVVGMLWYFIYKKGQAVSVK